MGCFTRGESSPGTVCIGDYIDLRPVLGAVGERKIRRCRELNPGLPDPSVAVFSVRCPVPSVLNSRSFLTKK
jgi:hypothetical protein